MGGSGRRQAHPIDEGEKGTVVKLGHRYIAVDGPMASGKTALTRHLAQALSAELILELKENPFLESFYKNKAGSAFQAQIFYLLNRSQVLADLQQPGLFQPLMISDFLLEKDRIYAYLNLSDSELMLYEKLYSMITQDRVKPDLVIYVQMSPERIMENLRKRRKGFLTVAEEYVESVVEGYNRFFFHYKDAPVIIINANQVCFDRDRVAFLDFLAFLEREHRGITYFTPQTS